jgi:hypothetical protein
VYRALGAGRLALLEGAFIKPLEGIVPKLFAFGAQTFTGMMFVAVKGYHYCHGFTFPFDSGTFISHGRPIIKDE